MLDKPRGVTSQFAVNRVKKLLKTKKAGHTGTLDPFATGVLPICLNSATKAIPYLGEDFKKYEAVIHLGIVTDTMDLTGRELENNPVGGFNKADIDRVVEEFQGESLQMPPMYSALKRDGVRLYELARKGVEVEREPRTIYIKDIKVLDYTPPYLKIYVHCSKGSYVRVLGSDIANELGCGGHLSELRRLGSGKFEIRDAVTIEDVEQGEHKILGLNEALSHLGEVEVGGDIASMIREGKQLTKSKLTSSDLPEFKIGDRLMVYQGRDIVCIAEAMVNYSELRVLKEEDVVLKLLRVFN